MNSQEYNEIKHDKDTGGALIYDLHCFYCVQGKHLENNFPPREFRKEYTFPNLISNE